MYVLFFHKHLEFNIFVWLGTFWEEQGNMFHKPNIFNNKWILLVKTNLTIAPRGDFYFQKYLSFFLWQCFNHMPISAKKTHHYVSLKTNFYVVFCLFFHYR